MPRRVMPTLTSLRAFEAYARHGRLVDAAAELCVTHGAVSRQIKQLERQLGVSLLVGHPGKVSLTARGRDYASELTRLFDGVEAASATLRDSEPARLQILSPGSITMRWLIPRVPEFTDRHPHIDLEIVDSNGPWTPNNTGPHGAIRMQGYEGSAAARSVCFLARRHGPVLSPELWNKGTQDLARLLTLPRLFTRSLARDWKEWAASTGTQLPQPSRETGFGRSFHMVESALNGAGVCVADYVYVAGDIEAGRLVAPLGFVDSAHGYIFLRASNCRNRLVDLFENWIVEAGSRAA